MSGTFDFGWPETASRGASVLRDTQETLSWRRVAKAGQVGVFTGSWGMKKGARGMRSEVLVLERQAEDRSS